MKKLKVRPAPRPATRAPKAAPATAAPKKTITIKQSVIDQTAKRKRGIHPFIRANHPDSVFPGGHKPSLAMDSAVDASLAWAAQVVLNGLFNEGLGFLGYPYLAELTQRAEYRVVSETLATESTREWIKIQATTVKGSSNSDDKDKDPGEKKPPGAMDKGPLPAPAPTDDPMTAEADKAKAADKTAKIKAIEAEFERLKVRDVFRVASEQDGFFGRSHIYIDIEGARDEPAELLTPIGNGRNAISLQKIAKGSLKRLQNIEPIWAYPSVYNAQDPLAPDWYRPQRWFVQGKEIHRSRFLTFVGREVPDLLKPAYSFGGLSMSQMAKPTIDNWLRTRTSVSDAIHNFSVMILLTDLSALLEAGGDELVKRLTLFTNLRDNNGVFALNKTDEDFKNVSMPLSGLHELQAQSQEHMASVTRTPLVKLLGIQPAGLNASSEGELQTWEDWVAAYQEKFYGEPLKRILGFVQLNLFGAVDPEITAIFLPLRQMTEKERGEIDKSEAEADDIRIGAGVLAPIEVRRKIAAQEDSPYASIDVEDVPEPPAEEAGGGEGGEGGDNPFGGGEGGGANDAALPFGFHDDPVFASLAEDAFNEADHPRGQPENAGQFGPGGGGGSKKEKQRLKMPQFGLTPTPHFAYHGYKAENASPMPKSSGEAASPHGVVVFAPGETSGVKGLGGTEFKSWSAPADWSQVDGQADVGEPPEPELPEGMELSAGVIIREADGRVWLLRPKGGYGGYNQTFPKGHVEDGLSMQATAIKEAYEETGLKVKIVGYAGDHEGDVTVTRFYMAERETGDPKDAGRESEGVILAPASRLKDFLNRKRDLEIAAALQPASEPLDPTKLTKVGKQMGSNPGGVYEDESGTRFYVKQGQTKDHVRNELTAAALYDLAGSPTLKYRPVAGGQHIATEMEKLDKDNAAKLSPAERKEAQREFAVHAWTGNYDAIGTGGDNLGTIQGVPVALDLGGALEYRAQGKPKGAMFGDKVSELDTLRDPKINPDGAKFFGSMTEDEIKSSVRLVTQIPDDAIRSTVNSTGGSDALADKLIARKLDMAKRYKIAMDEKGFEESKHPRVAGGEKAGQFAPAGGGGAGGGAEEPEWKPSLKLGGEIKQDYGGLWTFNADPKTEHTINSGKVLGAPAKTGNFFRNMVRRLIKDGPKFGANPEALQKKLGESYWRGADKLLKQAINADDPKESTELQAKGIALLDKSKKLGYLPPGGYAGTPAPAKPAAPPPPPPPPAPPPAPIPTKFPAPTDAEIEKAKKAVPLQLQYVQSAVAIQTAPGKAQAQKIIDAFNDKYGGNDISNNKPALIQKVNDFKALSAAMPAIAQAEVQNKDKWQAQQKAEAAAKAQQQKVAEAAAAKEAAQKNAHVMSELGITEHEAMGFVALAKMIGGSQDNLVANFKSYEKKAEQYGYPISGFEAALISNYSNGGYKSVNEALRKGSISEAQHVYVKMVNKALAKMPRHTGVLNRGTDLTPEQQALYVTGNVVEERAFTSTSTGGGFGGSTRYKITGIGQRGASIQKLSQHAGESEVLFAARTFFKVTKVEGKPGGSMTVHMTEMPANEY